MKIDKNKISKLLLIVLFIAIIILYLIYHFHGGFTWLKVEKQLENRYGCNLKMVSEEWQKNKDGTLTDFKDLKLKDEDGNEFYVKYSRADGIIEDDFANVVYSKNYVEDIKAVTDGYFDEYLCIPNFFDYGGYTVIPYENSATFEDYDAYIKDSGIKLNYTILIPEDADISSVDELIKAYEKAFSDRNIEIAVEQVPDDIYDSNIGVNYYAKIDRSCAKLDCSYLYYVIDDSQYIDFINKFGTAQFMDMDYNYYMVGKYNR